MPSPFVYWAQSDSHVFLKVDVKGASGCQVRIEEEEVEFSAVGTGGQGRADTRYHFVVEFFLPVDKRESSYEVKKAWRTIIN